MIYLQVLALYTIQSLLTVIAQWHISVIPVLGRQEDHKFESSLSNIMRPCTKKIKNKKRRAPLLLLIVDSQGWLSVIYDENNAHYSCLPLQQFSLVINIIVSITYICISTNLGFYFTVQIWARQGMYERINWILILVCQNPQLFTSYCRPKIQHTPAESFHL